jgi:hypothetical protein
MEGSEPVLEPRSIGWPEFAHRGVWSGTPVGVAGHHDHARRQRAAGQLGKPLKNASV